MSEGRLDELQSFPRDGMRVYVLDNGHLECDANLMVAGTVVGTREDKNPRTKWIKIPTYAVLIDHPNQRILLDLGTYPENIYPEEVINLFPYHYQEHQKFENQLALVGLRPRDISAVILSHLHFDHAGHLHLFEHADFYLHPSELKANPEISIRKAHLVEKDSALFPGVEVVTLPGHTAGLLGTVVHLKEEGTLIFPSDAVYTIENYGPPARPSGLVYDSLSYFESIEKVRKLEEKYDAKVMFAHDMEFFETMKKAPACYA